MFIPWTIDSFCDLYQFLLAKSNNFATRSLYFRFTCISMTTTWFTSHDCMKHYFFTVILHWQIISDSLEIYFEFCWIGLFPCSLWSQTTLGNCVTLCIPLMAWFCSPFRILLNDGQDLINISTEKHIPKLLRIQSSWHVHVYPDCTQIYCLKIPILEVSCSLLIFYTLTTRLYRLVRWLLFLLWTKN